ncbi:MAG: hypothetical protein K6G80_10585 [Treponema sp.]|nr:hypothetical protein [Treponema sp.]
MPGLKQLQAFNKDIQNLGNEIEIRGQRGEKPVVVPLPQGIQEEDDSQDFVLGLPDSSNPEQPVDGVVEAAPEEKPEVPAGSAEPVGAPDLDDLFASALSGESELPDLSEFEADVLPEAPAAEETPLEDLDLDALLQPAAAAEPEPALEPEPDSAATSTAAAVAASPSAPGTATEPEPLASFDDVELPEAESPLPEAPLAEAENDSRASAADSSDSGDESMKTLDSFPDDVPEVPEDATELSELSEMPDLPKFNDFKDDALSGLDLDSIPDLQTTLDTIGVTDDDAGVSAGDAASADEKPAELLPMNAADSELPDDFELPEETDENAETEQAPETPQPSDEEGGDALSGAETDASLPDFSDLPDSLTEPDAALSAEPDAGLPAESEADAASEPAPSGDALPDFDQDFGSEPSSAAASPDSFDIDGLNDLDPNAFSGDVSLPSVDDLLSGLGSSEPDSASPASSLFADDTPGTPPSAEETFDVDTSELDGLDFSSETGENPEPAEKKDVFASLAEEFPVTGGDDFELGTDFEIPGFSDTDTPAVEKKKLDSPDFSKASKGAPRNSLTEEEYSRFKQNLSSYPLNLRIVIEELIAKDEYTDDAVFEVIEKVLKKTPARSLAGHLEKLLDITIDVPRDFERRSVAEYEAYKQSFQYQLKNRILPGILVGIVILLIGYGLFRAGYQFIYKPAKAASLYKQGYTLLQNNEYPQSEVKFNEAVSYKPVKKWYFNYARGYREHKQFERAAQMYTRTLRTFKQDKTAGLEYAEMELYDRANYSRAEEIVRREVLDYHINDAAGILLLGDIFLEWADVDPSKYDDARTQYATLIQLYGGTDLYLSRLMRYFIRTDKLRNVLEMKNHFYSAKSRTVLSAEDWTELSGYLLDKLYGPLSKSDEYLRTSIEDVLDMLQTAVRMDQSNAVAHYNLARYYIENSNVPVAQRQLQESLDLFAQADVRTRRNAYKEIDASRLLGELFARDREYLKAQTAYTRGISVFNEENKKNGLPGDANTGKLFADMGDIEYFISGDLDSAQYNYSKAIEYHNDTPSLIYRVGAIQYTQKEYGAAMETFIAAAEKAPSDPNLLLALANSLSLSGDNFAAQGYYVDLISRLDLERARRERLMPQQDEDDGKIVNLYLKATNNLGVTLYRLAQQTGSSRMNADAAVKLSDSMRAWDALTRNPKTLVRLGGSNLAAQNSKYIMHPYPDFEPAIYTDIARVLYTDQELE